MRKKESDREALACAEREIGALRADIIRLDGLRAAEDREKEALRAALDGEKGELRAALDREKEARERAQRELGQLREAQKTANQQSEAIHAKLVSDNKALREALDKAKDEAKQLRMRCASLQVDKSNLQRGIRDGIQGEIESQLFNHPRFRAELEWYDLLCRWAMSWSSLLRALFARVGDQVDLTKKVGLAPR
jgi:chromosome segregation ATPase